MRARMQALIDEFDRQPPARVQPALVDETEAYLRWLARDHFTFLGYREYELIADGDEVRLQPIAARRSGFSGASHPRAQDARRGKALAVGREPQILLLTKANSARTVHRPSYLDYVGVKQSRRGRAGVGERRFLGLYTTLAYKASARSIPILRGKVEGVLERAGFAPGEPRPQGAARDPRGVPARRAVPDRAATSCSTWRWGSSARASASACACSCAATRSSASSRASCSSRATASTPTTASRSAVLLEALARVALDWTLLLSESVLARSPLPLPPRRGRRPRLRRGEIEARLVAGHARLDRRPARRADRGVRRGGTASGCIERYGSAFPAGYREDWAARAAVADIARIEELAPRPAGRSCARTARSRRPRARCAASCSARGGVLALGRAADVREHGCGSPTSARTSSRRADEPGLDLRLRAAGGRAEDVERRAASASRRPSSASGAATSRTTSSTASCSTRADRPRGHAPAGGRAVAAPGGAAARDASSQRALLAHPHVAALLVALFRARFDPARHDDRRRPSGLRRGSSRRSTRSRASTRTASCAACRWSRAMTRTDYCQRDRPAGPRSPTVVQARPARLALLPAPRPRFEIFVHSPRVEGVHLRGGRVARGGLRWSDRREDFRTEVLGLMKAQTVKNAVIVPVGAKGGFVVKRPPTPAGARRSSTRRRLLPDVRREPARPHRQHRRRRGRPAAAASCATTATTPTWSSPPTRARPPSRTSRTRSRPRYGFWLGDAFASGGSQGYDHKQHGDHRAGRVGGGQAPLPRARDRRPEDRLHGRRDRRHVGRRVRQRHAALAPHPADRRVRPPPRLPRPGPGPGGELRRARSACSRSRARRGATTTAPLISAGRRRLPADREVDPGSRRRRARRSGSRPALAPDELIRAILRAPVDLLWNGGIGTYVKATDETARRRRRPRQRRRPRRRGASCAAASSARAATSASRSAAASSSPRPAGGSTPTRSTTSAASTAPTARSTSRSCSTPSSPRAT